MFTISRKSIQWGGKTLTLESGRIARQADGAVLVTYGETAVLCTAVGAKKAKPDVDFFPLTVHYQEKFFAAGKIPGGFFKREGRPTEKEILVSRLIDRPIRPMFPEGFSNEVQVVCTLMSHDTENDSDILAIIGAAAALTISGLPFMGPIAAAKVGYAHGQYILNPTMDELKDSELDLVVAGTKTSVLMVESEAKELPEDVMLGAVAFGHKQMQAVNDLIIALAEDCAKEPWDIQENPKAKACFEALRPYEAKLRAAYAITAKQARTAAVDAVFEEAEAALAAHEFDARTIGGQFKKLEQEIVRLEILNNKKRIDGRAVDNVRPIAVEVGILPRTHGSALFTRGETQALVVATLGTNLDEQIIDAIEGEYKQAFMLHYNFPPYSVGETGRMSGPGRREIGHGKLAWRALRPVLPTKEQFPYTLRIVSEITESNGSSSMASVCGGSLSLMDAGVPLKRPVAGIAMGLIKEKAGFVVLSDIMGDEDHLGDMDFKVAGTEKGITALQMDIKINGITEEIMQIALTQAHAGRAHILGEMNKVINTAREEVSGNAPRITTIQIPKDKIREVIGSGGKVIREICEVSGAKVDIQDDGTINVAAVNSDHAKKALEMINAIVAEAEIGKVYDGKVVKIMEFGAFVNFIGAKDGLVHISELADGRVNKVEDVVKEGDAVKVKVLEIDNRGKIRLSMKVVDQATGEEIIREKKAAS